MGRTINEQLHHMHQPVVVEESDSAEVSSILVVQGCVLHSRSKGYVFPVPAHPLFRHCSLGVVHTGGLWCYNQVVCMQRSLRF